MIDTAHVHLFGYASLAAILGTAEWSALGDLLMLPLVVFALYVGAKIVAQELVDKAAEQTDGDNQ